MELVLPNRRGVGVSHNVGQRVNQQISLRGRLENFFRDLEEAAIDKVFDNGGAGRLGAYPVNVLELFLDGGVLNVLVNILHTLYQARRRKPRRGLGDALFKLGLFM